MLTEAASKMLGGLTSPECLFRPTQVLASFPSEAKGIYGWWFKTVPPPVPSEGLCKFKGMSLLYLGVGPDSERSRRFLRQRMGDHIKPDASRSTFRNSLGCILADALRLQLECVRTSRAKGGGLHLHFGFGSGEDRLSRWMEENTSISWVEFDRPWEIEPGLISQLALPLNLEHNSRHPFYADLQALRRHHREGAKRRVDPANHRNS
jgi:hypothetical protein